MSLTECIEWIHSKGCFTYVNAELKYDSRLVNPTKTTTNLSYREPAETKRCNIIYLRRMIRKKLIKIHQIEHMSNMTRCQSKIISLTGLRL
jgi:hypothetical protein